MNLRTLVIAAAVTAVLAPAMSMASATVKGNPPSAGFHGTSRATGPDGTPSANLTVDLSGISADAVCGGAAAPGAGSPVLTLNLGKNAVVTGLGGVGSYTSFSPSWRSEVLAIFRGVDPAEAIQLGFSNDSSSGVASYNIPITDLTSIPLANITTGASGQLTIEICEDFNDSITPDATFAPGSNLQIAYYGVPIPAPAMSTWSMLALLLGLGLVGGIAARRYS